MVSPYYIIIVKLLYIIQIKGINLKSPSNIMKKTKNDIQEILSLVKRTITTIEEYKIIGILTINEYFPGERREHFFREPWGKNKLGRIFGERGT